MFHRYLIIGILFFWSCYAWLGGAVLAATPTATDELSLEMGEDFNGAATVELSWPSSYSGTLDLFSTTNLANPDWHLVLSDVPTLGSSTFVWLDSEATNFPARFFIAGTDYNSDTDELTDAQEILLYNTQTNSADTDGDGIHDGDEVYADGTHGDLDGFLTDPLQPDTAAFVLPDLVVAAPTADLNGFSTFLPPVNRTDLSPSAPAIGEWTRSNDPGDTMAIAGEFGGTATRFLFFGESSHGRKLATGQIQRLAGRLAAVSLPESLPDDEMLLIWPGDENGWGRPAAINRTEAWWIGPDRIVPGVSFSVFGRNLRLGEGNCNLYIEELDQWITSTTSTAYKAEFIFPESANKGTYTCWAHNGHGSEYGWADPLEIEILEASGWNNDPSTWLNVLDYGAIGFDGQDDSAALLSALDDAHKEPWSTIYLPFGIYHLANRIPKLTSKVRIIGDGMEYTILQDHPDIDNERNALFMAFRERTTDGSEFRDLTFKHGSFHNAGALMDLDGSDMLFSNVRFDQSAIPYAVGIESERGGLDASDIRNVRFENCEFLLSGPLNLNFTENILFNNCRFEGLNDIGYMTSLAAANGVSFEHCTATHFDHSNANDGHGWAQGRFIYGSGGLGGIHNIHYAHNQTIDLFVRPGYSNQNTGEHFMHEYGETRWCGNPIAVSSNGFTVNRLYPNDIGEQLVVTQPASAIQTQIISRVDLATETVFIEGEWLGYSETDTVPAVIEISHAGRKRVSLDVASKSVTNNAVMVNRLYPDYVGETVAVMSGRGFGQHRTIIAYDIEETSFTLDKPWRVIPDASSLLAVGHFAARHVIHDSLFDADPLVLTDSSRASTGVQPFNGQFDLVVDGNIFQEMRKGVALWGMDGLLPDNEIAMQPSYFNLIKNNSALNCAHAFEIAVADWDLDPTSFEPSLAGNVWRNNQSKSAVINTFNYRRHNTRTLNQHLGIFDGNTSKSGTDPIHNIDGLNDQVWVGNTFSGFGTGITISDDHVPVLRENNWTGFALNYEDDVSGGVLELPVRHMDAVAANMDVPIWNSGTAPLSWTASETSGWITLSQAAGTVSVENGIGVLPITIDLASATGEAVISINANGQTQTIVVIAQ